MHGRHSHLINNEQVTDFPKKEQQTSCKFNNVGGWDGWHLTNHIAIGSFVKKT